MTKPTSPTPTMALLTRTERPDPAFAAAEVSHWPAGALEAFVRFGLLAAADAAESAVCDACGFDHVELVQWDGTPGPARRPFIACPSVGAVSIDPNSLRRWTVRPPALASAVASAVGAAGPVAARVPGRVWKLGPLRTGGRLWAASLAVGLTRPDAAAVVEAAPELRAPNALVFVPSTVPPATVWSSERAPAVVPLCDLLALGPAGLRADPIALASVLPAPVRAAVKGPARAFPTPPDASWESVTLTVGEHHLTVRVGTTVERFGFADAGFEDRREKNKPDDLWALLRVLARLGGHLGTGDATTTKPGSLKQKVSVLRDRLRALLALSGDPFHPNARGRPYRARFAVRTDGPATFPTPPGATWDDLTLTEIGAGIVEVSVTVAARDVAFVRDDDADGRWEGVTGESEQFNRFTLSDLGPSEPAADTLVALLRAGGRLTRPADDAGLLALGGALGRFFQLTEPPFHFDPKRRQWAARFGAAFAPRAGR